MARYDGLDGSSVVITGAARGLGAALASAFAAQGSRLLLVDMDGAALAETAGALELPEDHLATMTADLADVDALPGVINRARDAFGRLDVLVNNAAIVDGVPLDELTTQLFDRVIAVNLRAPLFLSRAAMEVMRGQGAGGRYCQRCLDGSTHRRRISDRVLLRGKQGWSAVGDALAGARRRSRRHPRECRPPVEYRLAHALGSVPVRGR